MNRSLIVLMTMTTLVGCGGSDGSSSTPDIPNNCSYDKIDEHTWNLADNEIRPNMDDVMSPSSQFCPGVIGYQQTMNEFGEMHHTVSMGSYYSPEATIEATTSVSEASHSYTYTKHIFKRGEVEESFSLSYRKDLGDSYDLDAIYFRHTAKELFGGAYVRCDGEVRHYGLDLDCTFTDTNQTITVPQNFMDEFMVLSDQELAQGDYATVFYNKVMALR